MSPHIARWEGLRRFCQFSADIRGLEVWLFGSALRVDDPRDIDVLVIYTDRAKLQQLVDSDHWELLTPPIDLIAMMPDEVIELQFIETTSAVHVQAATEADNNLRNDVSLVAPDASGLVAREGFSKSRNRRSSYQGDDD